LDEVPNCKFCGAREGCNPSDPLHVVEMERSWTFLDPNQTYRGHVIVVVKGHHEDIAAMPPAEGAALYAEMTRVAGAVRRACKADHMNYLSLGNVVRHVHWHIYPRYRDDANWGGAPIPELATYRLPDDEYRRIASAILAELAVVPVP